MQKKKQVMRFIRYVSYDLKKINKKRYQPMTIKMVSSKKFFFVKNFLESKHKLMNVKTSKSQK